MLNEIRNLNIEDYNELAERIKLFIKVKNLMKPKKHERTKKPVPVSYLSSLQ